MLGSLLLLVIATICIPAYAQKKLLIKLLNAATVKQRLKLNKLRYKPLKPAATQSGFKKTQASLAIIIFYTASVHSLVPWECSIIS